MLFKWPNTFIEWHILFDFSRGKIAFQFGFVFVSDKRKTLYHNYNQEIYYSSCCVPCICPCHSPIRFFMFTVNLSVIKTTLITSLVIKTTLINQNFYRVNAILARYLQIDNVTLCSFNHHSFIIINPSHINSKSKQVQWDL